MGGLASQITSLTIVYPPFMPFIQAQIKENISAASLAFVRGIQGWPVNSPHKWPVTRKMFPFDDVTMVCIWCIHMYSSGLLHVHVGTVSLSYCNWMFHCDKTGQILSFDFCRLIWKHLTYKIFVIYILSGVCLRLNPFSHLSLYKYMGLWVFSLPFSLLMIVRMIVHHLIVIIKSKIWIISYCLGLGNDAIACAVCLSTFLLRDMQCQVNPTPETEMLTFWGRDKMAAIFQKTFWNGFSWIKMHEFRLKFHWSLLLGFQSTIFQHWFR